MAAKPVSHDGGSMMAKVPPQLPKAKLCSGLSDWGRFSAEITG